MMKVLYVMVPSDSNSYKEYKVSYAKNRAEEWQCSCMGWTRHYPRHDCKHILRVKESHLKMAVTVR